MRRNRTAVVVLALAQSACALAVEPGDWTRGEIPGSDRAAEGQGHHDVPFIPEESQTVAGAAGSGGIATGEAAEDPTYEGDTADTPAPDSDVAPANSTQDADEPLAHSAWERPDPAGLTLVGGAGEPSPPFERPDPRDQILVGGAGEPLGVSAPDTPRVVVSQPPPACTDSDDPFEEDDNFDAATPITFGTYERSACRSGVTTFDVDDYEIGPAPSGRHRYITLSVPPGAFGYVYTYGEDRQYAHPAWYYGDTNYTTWLGMVLLPNVAYLQIGVVRHDCACVPYVLRYSDRILWNVDGAFDASPWAVPYACEPDLIEAGATYGHYVVDSVELIGAPPGDYTFHLSRPSAGNVEVRRDGVPVMSLAHAWQTTVGASIAYTFDFAGLFRITVRKAGTRTMNLYDMNESIFDSRRILHVPWE